MVMTWQSAAVASSIAVKHLHVLTQLHHGPYMSKVVSSCQADRETAVQLHSTDLPCTMQSDGLSDCDEPVICSS